MATRQVGYEIRADVQGRESINALADDLDNVARVLDTQLSQQAQAAAVQLRELARQDAAITEFARLQTQVRDSGRALSAAETEAANFSRQISEMGPPTAQEAISLARLQAAADSTRASFAQQQQSLAASRAQLQSFGIASQNTQAAQQRLRTEVTLVRNSVQGLVPAWQNAASSAQGAGGAMARTHRQIGDGVQSISQQLSRFQSIYAGLAGLQGLKGVATELATTADEVNNLQARIKLVTGEGENFQRSWDGIAQLALRTHSALDETGVLFTRLAQSGKDAGLSTAKASEEALGLTETINQAIQLSGASAQASSAAIIQLVQGLQSGVLRGDEFNSVMEQAPRLVRTLTDDLGVTTGELRKMAEAGTLTSDTIIKALKGQSATVAEEFSQLPPTVGRALQDLSTQWSLYIADSDKATGASATAAKSIEFLADNLRTISDLFIGAGKATAAFAALRLAQYFFGVSTATQQAASATAAHTAATVNNTAVTVSHTAATVVNTAATTANAAAHTAVANGAQQSAGQVARLGTQASASAVGVSRASVLLGRFAGLLGGLPTFALLAIVTNFKEIGTWIGESAAKLAGYKDRSEELARADKLNADIAKEAADARALLAIKTQIAIDRQYDLSKAANAAVGEFDKLTKEGTAAGESIKKASQSFDLTKVVGIRDYSAMLAKLSADGKISAGEFQKAWSEALSGQDLAVFEVKARAAYAAAKSEGIAAAKAVEEAMKSGASGEVIKALQAKAEAAFTAAAHEGERVATMMDAVLRESVKRTGLDFESLQGKIGATARSSLNDLDAMVNGLDKLKAQGVDTGRALTASLSKAIDTADGQKAVDAVRERIEQVRKVLGDKVTDGFLEQAKLKAQELADALDKATPGINSLTEAMGRLGVTSDETLKATAAGSKDAYDTMAASGKASAREISAGFKRAAEEAIAANNGVAPAWVKSSAAVRGFQIETDSSGKAIVESMKKAEDATRRAGDAANGAASGYASMGQAAANALQNVQRLTQGERNGEFSGQGEGGSFVSKEAQALADKAKALAESGDMLGARATQRAAQREDEIASKRQKSGEVRTASVMQYDINQDIAKRYGDDAVGLASAQEAWQLRQQLDSYRKSYGNVVRSQESMNQERNIAAELTRVEAMLDQELKSKSGRAAEPVSPAGPNKSPHEQVVRMDITLDGKSLGAVKTDDAGRQVLAELMRQLAQAKGAAIR